MPIPISATSSQLNAAALSSAVLHETQQVTPLVHDPIGPVALDRLAAVAINPQPLPPEELSASIRSSLLDAVALNPQPLPPKELGASIRSSLLDAVALNPQPLPPRWLSAGASERFNAVAINPQPLPPGSKALLRTDDYCGLGHLFPNLPHPPVGPGTSS